MIGSNHSHTLACNWFIYAIASYFLKKSVRYCKGILDNFGCGEAPCSGIFSSHSHRYIGVRLVGGCQDTRADVATGLNIPFAIASEVADTVVSRSITGHLCDRRARIP